MARNQTKAQETRQHILDVAPHFVFATRGPSTSLAEIAKAAELSRAAQSIGISKQSRIYSSEIWELAKPNIDELETEYQAKFPDDPLSVLREILIYVL